MAENSFERVQAFSRRCADKLKMFIDMVESVQRSGDLEVLMLIEASGVTGVASATSTSIVIAVALQLDDEELHQKLEGKLDDCIKMLNEFGIPGKPE